MGGYLGHTAGNSCLFPERAPRSICVLSADNSGLLLRTKHETNDECMLSRVLSLPANSAWITSLKY